MNNNKNTNQNFQIFYISKEITNCPLIIEIIKISKKLREKDIIKKDNDAVFSLGFGKRIIINGLVKDFSDIKRDELLEIVDFDPIKNNLLLIGPAKPKIETSLHWMIHHARDDINFIAQIKNTDLIKELKDVEITDKYPIGSLDNTKEVLKALRTNKKIIIKNNGLLVVGRNTEDVEKQIQETFKV
jgi:ribulose-5-phosphate 4-epimerase/fuculose-1-phosphate aldolase